MRQYPMMNIEITYLDEDDKENTVTRLFRNVIKFEDSQKHKAHYEITVLTDDLSTYTNLVSKLDVAALKIYTAAPIRQYRRHKR